MSFINILLIILSSFNLIISITILKRLWSYRKNKKKNLSRFIFMIVLLISIASLLYIPAEISYCAGEKLSDIQDSLWSLYEGLVHIIKLSFLLLVKYRLRLEEICGHT